MKSQGIGNVTPLMALMAQLTSFTGSSGEAAGSLEAMFNGLLRIAKNKDINSQLKARGIDFFDSKGGVKNINELLPMIRKFGEELKKSGKSAEEGAMAVFGRPEAAKSIMIIMDKYDEVMKKQAQLAGSSGSMGKDYNDAQESMSAKLTRFQNQIDAFNVNHMSDALKRVSSVLDFLNTHPIISKGLMTAILGVGGLVMVNKVIESIRGIAGVFGGKAGGGIAGKLGGAPMPVYVVNFPGSGMSMPLPGGWTGEGGPAGAGGAGGSKLMSILGKAGLVAGVGIAAYEIASLVEKKFIGGAIGNKLYDMTHKGEAERGSLQDRLNNQLHDANMRGDKAAAKAVQNQIKLVVNIDKNGQVNTESDDTNTFFDVGRGGW
jgi:hypothetical protein